MGSRPENKAELLTASRLPMLAMMSPLAPMRAHALMADALMDHTFRMCDAFEAASAFRLNSDKPRVDESDDRYTITVRAPGVAASDLTVTAEEGHIVLAGQTKTESHTHVVNYSVRLPRNACPEEASALVVDGLITVHVPKKEVSLTTITVSSSTLSDVDVPTECEDEAAKPYKLTVVAAGVAASDLELTAEDGTLKICGETKRTGARFAGRSFRLPEDADATKARASHVDGILTVTVPKKPVAPAEAKHITVNASEDVAMEADDKGDENEEGEESVMV